ncbi:MAG: hypothetical protein Q8Q62_01395 [Mesorhizobium sp.]|nr:hypothetical protein [Mesorhizobium sp.]
MRPAICLIALGLSASSALAEADFIKGVHLQTEELCAAAKKDGLQSVIEAGNVLLTANGLESIEYNCEFVQIIKATRAPAWAVTAICQEPGYLFPDMLSIVQMSPTQIDIVSVRPVNEDGGDSGNTGSYYLCPDVPLP